MSDKQKVLVCVPCVRERDGWVNPALCTNLLTIAADQRYIVEVEMVLEKRPYHYARNYCVSLARERAADWLLMVDNDQAFTLNPLTVLSDAGADKYVIGFPTFMGQDIFETDGKMFQVNLGIKPIQEQKIDGQFYTVSGIGGAGLLINHRIWEEIPGPWFLWEINPTELAETAKQGSEDIYFCRLVQKHGFDIWAHTAMMSHLKTTEVTMIGVAQMRQRVMAQRVQTVQHAPAPQAQQFAQRQAPQEQRWVTAPHQPR